MVLELSALAVMVFGGLLALLTYKKPRLCTVFGAGGTVVGCLLGLIPAVKVLLGSQIKTLHVPWDIPYGSFFVQIDALSAFFLIPIFGLSAVAAIYGGEYLLHYRDTKRLGPPWFFYSLLTAGMAMVVMARNGVLFLIAWEIMSLASFFLVTFEDEEESVRQAGWTYLVATHLGTAFLIVFFILLGRQAGTLDFDRIGPVAPALTGILFLLAVVGFGTKAGFMPLHVWLPEAHPAAPSHVSAVMSGVMIKTGIYGLLRAIQLIGPPQQWWCWVLIGIGLSSGLLGVLFALAQNDLKRLLAYSSVENIGIITLGLGVGLLGINIGSPALAVLGFAGGLFHVLNHATFKSLLFLGAGAVLHGTGTRNIDHLGGLMKRMPWTGLTFLIGAIAISGLPPLNGFVSECLIYLGVFKGPIPTGVQGIIPLLSVIGGLALIGGLAAACFTKAFGMVFLGEPRTSAAAHAHEAGPAMRYSMLILAGGCIFLGFFSPMVIRAGIRVLGDLTHLSPLIVTTQIAGAQGILLRFVEVAAVFVGLATAIAVVRWRILARRPVTENGTWDCGYAKPTVRMQYTASSFAQPLVFLFRMFLRTQNHFSAPKGVFPQTASLHTDTPDTGQKYIYSPVFGAIETIVDRLRWLQHGRVQMYVLYIALALWILLIWKLW
ncbi:MAG: proton-conducting transporter membrane subunit [Phycisphaerae bacterium]